MKRHQQDAIFKQWVSDNAGLIEQIARSFARPGEQDDIAQEILLALWRAVPAFRQASSPGTYIYRVAQNAALGWHRRARRHRYQQVANSEDLPAAEHGDRDQQHSLYAAIRELPSPDRALLAMHLAGHDYATIADTLGWSASNVGARLTRLRQALARQLGE